MEFSIKVECSVQFTCEGGIWECQKQALELERDLWKEKHKIVEEGFEKMDEECQRLDTLLSECEGVLSECLNKVYDHHWYDLESILERALTKLKQGADL